MNVEHRHSVPFSLFPLGPSGREHIQNDRPWFIPGFLVTSVMQGSSWPSHRGGGFLVNNLDHDSLLTIGSITVSLPSFAVDVTAGKSFPFRGDFSVCETWLDDKSPRLVLEAWLPEGVSGSSATAVTFDLSDSLDSVPVACLGLKKPFRFCWPLAGVFFPKLALVFERFGNGSEVSLFSVLLLALGFTDGAVSGIDLDFGFSCPSAFEASSVLEETAD